MFIQDVFVIENLQILSEANSKGPLKIRGVFGRCNEKNNNGRVYPKNVLENQIKKFQPMIAERRWMGELDHPEKETVKLANASHLITKLELVGDEVIGEAEILNTPGGMVAKALIEGGVKVGISSRGMGTLSEDGQGNKVVNEDFKLVTFDLVADPSTRDAFPGINESRENKFVSDSLGKLKGERTFVTLLESKFRDAYRPIQEEKRKKKKRKVRSGYWGDNGGDSCSDGGGSMGESTQEAFYNEVGFILAEALGLVSEMKATRDSLNGTVLRSRKSGEKYRRNDNDSLGRKYNKSHKQYKGKSQSTLDLSKNKEYPEFTGVNAQNADHPGS